MSPAAPRAAPSPPPPRKKDPEYAVKLAARPLAATERDYNDVIHRYVRLYVSADFAKTVCTWLQARAPPSPCHPAAAAAR